MFAHNHQSAQPSRHARTSSFRRPSRARSPSSTSASSTTWSSARRAVSFAERGLLNDVGARRITTLSEIAGLKPAKLQRRRDAAEAAAAAGPRAARARPLRSERRSGHAAGVQRSRRANAARPAARARAAPARRGNALRETLSDDFDVESLLGDRCRVVLLAARSRARRGAQSCAAAAGDPGPDRPARPAPTRRARRSPPSSAMPRKGGLGCVRIVHGKGHGSPGREPVLKHQRTAGWSRRRRVAFTMRCRRRQRRARRAVAAESGRLTPLCRAQGASLAASAITALAADDPG